MPENSQTPAPAANTNPPLRSDAEVRDALLTNIQQQAVAKPAPLARAAQPTPRTYASDLARAQGASASAPKSNTRTTEKKGGSHFGFPFFAHKAVSAKTPPEPPVAPAQANPVRPMPAPTQTNPPQPAPTVPAARIVAGSTLPQMPAHKEPAPPPKKKMAPPMPTVSPLHTYKSDFADRIRQTGATQTDVLAAEQDAASTQTRPTVLVPRERAKGRGLWFAVGGALLLVVGIGSVLYAYQYRASMPALTQATPAPSSLIFTDAQEEVAGTGQTLTHAVMSAAAKPVANGTVTLLYLATTTQTTRGATVTYPEPGGRLIAALGLPLPDLLANSIALDSTFGLIRAAQQTNPFFILHVTSYDNAFAGMLRWERTMASDLALFYPPYPTIPTATASTTAPVPVSITSTFSDAVVANHDVRILRDAAGNTVLLYGFWNKNTLVIARNTAAFTELLSRLGTSNTQ